MIKKLHTLFIASLLVSSGAFAQAICNANGNVIIYSNYDGGELTIDVDQNIPNIKIGIVSYEFARITITGTYAGNVTEVRWAGYNGSNNHCNLPMPYTTSITGVPNNVDTMILYPPVSYSNPNGYNSIICNYSCSSTTNQGGCNTPDQLAYYFLNAFGGILYYHHTQYGCWTGTNVVSAGGNCCIVPIGTGVTENNAAQNNLPVTPNPSDGNFLVALPVGISTGEIKIYTTTGEEILAMKMNSSVNISLEGEAAGIYFIMLLTEKGMYSQRVIISE
ncbi:MAG: T9SS type A sorting domain-containing protein [Bacteroidota bacterium]|nr:T9SS type A sorting domain-containing protein [Bacteroidota bacterium]